MYEAWAPSPAATASHPTTEIDFKEKPMGRGSYFLIHMSQVFLGLFY